MGLEVEGKLYDGQPTHEYIISFEKGNKTVGTVIDFIYNC